jgi:hypothetical protein
VQVVAYSGMSDGSHLFRQISSHDIDTISQVLYVSSGLERCTIPTFQVPATPGTIA